MAAPILEEFNVPATFYISSGLMNSTKMFWTDILEDCINRTKKSKIIIRLGKEKVKLKLNTSLEKVISLEIIKKFCKACKKSEKDNIIDNVIYATNVEPSEKASLNYRKLTWNQIKIMDSNKLFTIGGHSTYHDILSLQPPKMAEQDINLSLDLLEYNLERKVLDYSYPEGQSNHFNNKIITFLKKRRIHLCPSAINGTNKIDDDLFKLKRIMVGFWNLPFPFFDKNLKS
jgi:peptidoglycan/xylan/chitin deacetylase (PgdA/CDA1 family)